MTVSHTVKSSRSHVGWGEGKRQTDSSVLHAFFTLTLNTELISGHVFPAYQISNENSNMYYNDWHPLRKFTNFFIRQCIHLLLHIYINFDVDHLYIPKFKNSRTNEFYYIQILWHHLPVTFLVNTIKQIIS